MFEGALTAPSPTPTLHSAASSASPCSETLLPGPCPQLREQPDCALRWGQGHGPPCLFSMQLTEPRSAGSGCPCLRLWPSSCWMGSSFWAAKGSGGGGLQQRKAWAGGPAQGVMGALGGPPRVQGRLRPWWWPLSSVSASVTSTAVSSMSPPSILTSPYKDTHHWIEGPPSSSLIWRDRGYQSKT